MKFISTFARNFVKQNITFQRYCSCINSFTWRTHTCGELNSQHVGQNVTLCGWMSFLRMSSKFIIIRDSYGHTQLVFHEEESLTKKYVKSLPLESVVQIEGIVKKRPLKDINKKLTTGEIEVEVVEFKLLNASMQNLPITSKDQTKANEVTKYKYRYLSLRSSKLQENLRTRSKVLAKMREFLHDKHGFVDVETPTLFKRTPGGAKEFIVPTKFPGKFYSLVQSPQQFKQLLMVGGMDRYFQIAHCYRNEGTKADRQPEFTQVDIELSYTTAKDVQNLVESLIVHSWPEENGPLSLPFQRISYADAIRYYGTDKPDLRYEMKLQDLTLEFKDTDLRLAAQCKEDPNFIVSAISVPRGATVIKNSIRDELKKLAETQSITFIPVAIKDDHSWTSAISKHTDTDFHQRINSKLNSSPGDLIFIAAGHSLHTNLFLGKARIRCAEHFQSIGFNIMNTKLTAFVWVTDFPLFLKDENGLLESAHHPFTAPNVEDIDLVYTNPEKARSQHYDLVLNGNEVGGGSIRIHDSDLQRYVIEDVLKEDSTSLKYLLDALQSGCPPHGGIALGIDRILAVMCGCQSITDVIAFPKSLDGKDLMSGIPCEISKEDKLLYHIEPIIPKEEDTIVNRNKLLL